MRFSVEINYCLLARCWFVRNDYFIANFVRFSVEPSVFTGCFTIIETKRLGTNSGF